MIQKEEKKVMKTTQIRIISQINSISSKSPIIQNTEEYPQKNVQTTTTKNFIIPQFIVVGKSTTIQTSSSTLKKEVCQKPSNFEESTDLIIKLECEGELKNKIREIEDIQKLNVNKINLTLSTEFNSDFELNGFIQSLKKVMSTVRNLKWIIKGNLEDSGSGQYIGGALKKCKSLYSLHLELLFPFLDSSALQLASSLQQLKDLRILKLWISDPHVLRHYFTDKGNRNIKNSIEQLKELQILEYNNIDPSFSSSNINLYNLTFQIISEKNKYNEYPKKIIGQNKRCLAEQLEGRDHKITGLNLTNNIFDLTYRDIYEDYYFQQYQKYGEQKRYSIRKFYKMQLELIDLVFSLPYLTSFRVSYFLLGYRDEFPISYPDEQLTKKELIAKELIKQRFLAVQTFVILAKQAYNKIPLNPNQLFSDLYFN